MARKKKIVVAQASPPASLKASGETSALYSGWHDRGYLPHLKVEGGTYFVTFRLGDTLAKAVLEQYLFEREEIIKQAKAMGRELSPDEEKRLTELYSERIERYLDAGYGKCWLKIPEIAKRVVDTLRHFDGSRYDLHAWVVMPNHVHAVVTPRKDYTLSNILHSWKSFTAHEVHKVAQAGSLQIPRGEAFWQQESYDHLVRDEADFARVCEYTIQNPVIAGLCKTPEEWPFSSAGVPPALLQARRLRYPSPWISREGFLQYCQNAPNALHPLMRLFLLSDGTALHFLHAAFLQTVTFELFEQSEIVISGEDAQRLPHARDEKGIKRSGWLQIQGTSKEKSPAPPRRIIHTVSLFPIAGLPPNVYSELQMRKKPLGQILYDQKLTFRRDHLEIGQCILPSVASGFCASSDTPLWARRCRLTLSGIREASGIVFEALSPKISDWTEGTHWL